ncbi:MAG: recombination-associated protein RdgC [Gammaproteobacteria bacterium]|nr:recombination-associated protein RdgC [Gammaproteobacteria bacterium]
MTNPNTMWFKNLRIYRFTKRPSISSESLAEQLEQHPFRPCSSVDFSRSGWVSPLGNLSDQLVHSVGQYHLFCARRQEKIMPAAAVNELVEEKVQAFEAQQARKIYRKEKLRLKDDVLHSLLPQALTRSAYTFAYIDNSNKYLVIDTTSAARADDFMDALRASMGELAVVPLACHGDAAQVMTRWIKSRTPTGFELDDECELTNEREKRNTVKCKNQDLGGDEIRTHLNAGKRVTQLALAWRNAIRFILTDDFTLRRVKFEDSISEDAGDDAAAQFDQDFAVMTIQVTQLLQELLEEFGGVAKAR